MILIKIDMVDVYIHKKEVVQLNQPQNLTCDCLST